MFVFVAIITIILIGLYFNIKGESPKSIDASPLRSVNFHFLRECNYACKYCFHVDKGKEEGVTTDLSLEEAKEMLRLLREAGCEKINFSGGEPFLNKKHLGLLVQYSKQELNLKTGIISNGSLIKEKWMEQYGLYLDWLGISVDSFDKETLINIGRRQGSREPAIMLKELHTIKSWCENFGTHFKINTVVSHFNKDEDMREPLQQLAPERWKVFQALGIDGENKNREASNERGSEDGHISSEEYSAFIERHTVCEPIIESNEVMRDSYVIVDEKGRFLDNSSGSKKPSESILKVGNALRAFEEGNIKFDSDAFVERKGHEAVDVGVVDIEDIGQHIRGQHIRRR